MNRWLSDNSANSKRESSRMTEKRKVPHTPEDVRELADEIQSIADRVRRYADEMPKVGLPEFVFPVANARNQNIYELKLWLLTLEKEWQVQITTFERSQQIKAKADRAKAAGKRPTGRPKKSSK